MGQKVEKLLSDTERRLRKTDGEPVDFDVDTPVEFNREDGETFFAETPISEVPRVIPEHPEKR